MLWYHTGVVDERTPKVRKMFPFEFSTFEEADRALANRRLETTVETANGDVLARRIIPMTSLEGSPHPLVYFSTNDGRLRNSYVVGQDRQMFLTVRNLANVRNLQLVLVPNRYGWRKGASLRDVRNRFRDRPQSVTIERGRDSVAIPLGPFDETMVGAYDVIVRLDRDEILRRLHPSDLITFQMDTAVLLQLVFDPPWAPGDFDIAGRPDKNFGYPYFEFHDVFEVGETMWGTVDPAILPSSHPSGRYAAFYVIPEGSAASGLVDQSSALEIVPIKTGCINGNMHEIWSNPSEGAYDIVVDFGSTSAMAQGDWQADGTFNAGVDFIDRATSVGAYVVNDPANPGPHTAIAHTYQPASTSASDPLRTDVSTYFNSPDSSVAESMDNVPLRGVGYYPSGAGPFPLVLIAHGNHNDTHPSHTGYGYLCQLLASHGMIAVSVDENFLNGSVSGEMDARAIVLLRHLQRWRDWNNTPGHTFQNKVNMNKIGLAGHSRGGEAITVANLFNTTLHNAGDPDHNFGFTITSLYAIAPVDGQIGTGYPGTPIVVNNADYFIMHGSHDGDVFTMGGQRTYDRAFPVASSAGGSKGLLFVQGANHNYWNTEWASHSNDGAFVTSPLTQITAGQQQDIGRVYVSAFFQLTLLDRVAYGALLTGDVSFATLPSGVELVHQYSDQDRVDLNNYEEDHNSTTGSFTGVTNSASGVSPLLDVDITGGWSFTTHSVTSSHFTWNKTSGLVAGWNSTSATYEISLPSSIGGFVFTHPYLSFRIGQVYEDPAAGTPVNPAGGNKDLSVQLELSGSPVQPTHTLKVSNFDNLPYPVETKQDYPWTFAVEQHNTSKSLMKTVRIPLRSFVVNKASWNLANVQKITIKFNVSGTGLIVLDDIQLTK